MNRFLRALWNELSPARTSVNDRAASESGLDTAPRKRGIQRSRPTMLAMEARLMFDGAAVDTAATKAADTTGANAPADPPESPTVPPAVETAASPQQRNEVVFVEGNIDDYQSLIDGVNPEASVYVLDASQNGLAQIAQILAGRSGIDAIHIFSHGAEASLGLGTLNLNENNLLAHAAELSAIGQSLSAQADILLYGCKVGAGTDGTAFISSLATLTGADIAASNNLTGAAAKGGDWVLENASGNIDTATLHASGFHGVLVGSLAYSDTTFTEAAGNDGSITTTSTITLTGDTFNGNNGDPLGSVTNVPAGLTASLVRASATTATLSFTGNAAAHNNANDVSNLTVTFADGDFAGGSAAAITDSTTSNLVIDFADPSLSYSGTTFSEAAANDGSITTTRTITLSGDTFTGNNGDPLGSVTNVPAGLTASLVRASATTATLSFTGNAAAHANANDVSNLTVTFADGDFTGGSAAIVTGATTSNLVIDFANPALSYSGTTFSEVAANDGSITTTRTITLSGDTFTGANGASLGSVTNVPAGLTASLVRASATTATLSFTGNAAAHANANDVSNLTVTFADGDFTGGSAAIVTGATTSNLVIDFSDPPSLSYGTTTFTEAAANDGSITVTCTITLANDTFTGNNGDPLGSVTNVPAGLTASLVRASATTATLSFTGNAAAHNNSNDIANLTVTFADGDFTGGSAAGVTGSTTSNLVIDFANPALSYSGTTFTEAGVNDGSITTTRTITLSGDTFTGNNGDPLGSVTNVPAGLTASLVRASATTATLSFTGNAAAHANANDVSNLTVTFADGDFTSGSAAIVTGATTSNLVIDFSDPKTLSYGTTTFTEAAANDGSITVTSTITLTNDTFTGANGASLGSVTNVPAGLTASLVKVDSTHALLSFTGNAAAHNNADDIANLTVTFADGDFTGGSAAGVTGSTTSNLVIDFTDPALSYSTTTFTEASANDGSITTTCTITLTGDTFTGANGASLGSVTNVPAGLTASLVKASATTATLSFTGNAAAHANADDIANLTVTFADGDFTGGVAAVVTGATTSNLLIDFADPTSTTPAPVTPPQTPTPTPPVPPTVEPPPSGVSVFLSPSTSGSNSGSSSGTSISGGYSFSQSSSFANSPATSLNGIPGENSALQFNSFSAPQFSLGSTSNDPTGLGGGRGQGGAEGSGQGQGQGGAEGSGQGQGQGGTEGNGQGQGQGGTEGNGQGQGQSGPEGRGQGQGQGGTEGRGQQGQGQGGPGGRGQGGRASFSEQVRLANRQAVIPRRTG